MLRRGKRSTVDPLRRLRSARVEAPVCDGKGRSGILAFSSSGSVPRARIQPRSRPQSAQPIGGVTGVATLDDEEMRCRGERCVHSSAAAGARGKGVRRSAPGTGPVLEAIARASTVDASPKAVSVERSCRWFRKGSRDSLLTLAPCRAICHLRSGRRLWSCSLVVWGARDLVSARSHAVDFPRALEATLGATVGRSNGPPPPDACAVVPGGRSSEAGGQPGIAFAMSRTACGLCSGPRERCCSQVGCRGGVRDRGRSGAGERHGVRSRSTVGSASTSPMMSGCGPLTKRSLSRSMCRAVERSPRADRVPSHRLGRCGPRARTSSGNWSLVPDEPSSVSEGQGC